MNQRRRSRCWTDRAVWLTSFCLCGAVGGHFSVAPRAHSADEPKATVIEQSRTELAAAQQRLDQAAARQAEAQATVATARRKLLGEEAWAARQAASASRQAEENARGALKAKIEQLKAAQEKLAAARKAVEKAAAEVAAAQQAADAADDDKKAEAAKTLAEKTKAIAPAAEALTAAQQAVDKAAAERKAAEQAVAERKAQGLIAEDAAAAAHARALGGLPPITSDQWDYAKARHLLFRAGFGGTAEEVQELVAMGPQRAVEHLVEYRRRPLLSLTFNILPWERPLSYEQMLNQDALNRLAEQDERRDATQHAALIDWWVQRMAETPRPLEEKLVLFWHDHFASSYITLRDAFALYQQNQFFRRHADDFDALLHGIVQDPAMIRYLNNDENVAGNHNENLGRELLELFSLGEENSAAHQPGGYTEQDVRDANTRALTGATYERYSGQFRFYATKHDNDAKTLLGRTGNWGPHEAVEIMLQHPATARYLAKKLWQYFAQHNADPATVEQLAVVLRENGYQLRPLLSNLFLSQAFYSDQVMASHVKSPVELLVGTVKVTKLPNPNYKQWRHLLSNMGQALFDPPSVAGWPEARHWINTNLLLLRYTAVADLIKDGKADYVAMLNDRQFQNAGEVVDHFARCCLLTNLSPAKRQSLVDLLGPLPPSQEWAKDKTTINAQLRALMMLLVSSPEYQVS